MLVDTHAHLTHERFQDDVEATLARASEAGVAWLVTIASDLADAERAVALAERFPQLWATAGIHPHSAAGATPDDLDRVRELAAHDRVVAIGETGLDYYYDNAPRDTQIEVFRAQIELGAELDLPVVVHAREADEDVADLIEEVGWGRGVLHCFSGSGPLMDRALGMGWFISFAGMVTFRNWDQSELLRSVPLDRLLVETDSPYLAPVPHRGKRNEPAFVAATADRVAEIRGDDPAALRAATSANARTFYRIDV